MDGNGKDGFCLAFTSFLFFVDMLNLYQDIACHQANLP